MKIWNEEVWMRVIHPDGTTTTDVMAYTIFDAKLQAAARWNLTPEQLKRPLETITASPLPGLRLIPYRAVGAENGLLLAMRFPAVRVGGRVLVPVNGLRAWLDQQAQNSREE